MIFDAVSMINIFNSLLMIAFNLEFLAIYFRFDTFFDIHVLLNVFI